MVKTVALCTLTYQPGLQVIFHCVFFVCLYLLVCFVLDHFKQSLVNIGKAIMIEDSNL